MTKETSEQATSPRRLFKILRAWTRAILGTGIVLGGIAAAVATVWARRHGEMEWARTSAIASLIFVVLMVVFVVPPLTRSARAETARLDLPVQITSGGLIFVAIFLIVAFAAWNTGNNLLFLIFSVLASTLFVAWTAARASLRDLVVSARFPDHIFAGEPAPVIVTLHNTKRLLPSFSVLVEGRSREIVSTTGRWRRGARQRFAKRVLAYFMYVPHRARVEQRVAQLFPQRGHELITGFEISTRFPFGFFRVRRRLHARNVDLIIYPKPEPAGDELHLLPIHAGRLPSARRGAGHDLYSLRDYQPQDDMRHIDWKATARASRLVVREFAAEDERRVEIALDTRLHDERADAETDFKTRFERGVTLAASLVSHFIEERAEVRLTLGDETGRFGIGREHLYASLRRLALVAPAAPAQQPGGHQPHADFWQHLTPATPSVHGDYVVLLTTAAPGSIPSNLWRKSHVIYL